MMALLKTLKAALAFDSFSKSVELKRITPEQHMNATLSTSQGTGSEYLGLWQSHIFHG